MVWRDPALFSMSFAVLSCSGGATLFHHVFPGTVLPLHWSKATRTGGELFKTMNQNKRTATKVFSVSSLPIFPTYNNGKLFNRESSLQRRAAKSGSPSVPHSHTDSAIIAAFFRFSAPRGCYELMFLHPKSMSLDLGWEIWNQWRCVCLPAEISHEIFICTSHLTLYNT